MTSDHFKWFSGRRMLHFQDNNALVMFSRVDVVNAVFTTTIRRQFDHHSTPIRRRYDHSTTIRHDRAAALRPK